MGAVVLKAANRAINLTNRFMTDPFEVAARAENLGFWRGDVGDRREPAEA
jgi:hypothetical protein